MSGARVFESRQTDWRSVIYSELISAHYKPLTTVTGFLFGFFIPEDGTDRLSRNVGKELPLLAA